MREDIWLNFDSKVTFDDVKNPQRILIINPESLKSVSAEKIWEKITGNFGKYEFEMWVSEVIVAATMSAAADGSKVADLTFIAGAVLCINCDFPEYSWEVLKNNETFMLLFRNLKIFKIVKNTQEELLLEYID